MSWGPRGFVLDQRNPWPKSIGLTPDRTLHIGIVHALSQHVKQVELLVLAARPAKPLLKAVARAHQWYGWILTGKALSQTSIAKQIGVNPRYVIRVLQCAFLAPDIVEAILDGRQPPDLTFEKLTKNVPLSWMEQRKQFGFPAIQS